MSTKEARPNYTERERMRKRLAAIGAPCAICGKPIDYTLDWWVDPRDGKRKRHPYSFEYDHKHPHALGGDNTFSNAQAAHRICNQRKGAGKKRKQSNKQSNARKTKLVEKVLPTSRLW